jgi:hypothetical protein
VRVYLPTTPRGLRTLREHGYVGPGPLDGHAVTDAVRAVLDDVDEEDREYLVLSSASLDCLTLLGPDEPPARVVLAVDTDEATPVGDPDTPSAVRVTAEVPLRRVAAVHADSAGARDVVTAARDAVSADADDADALVVRCLDHELGWYGVQEIDDLLAVLEDV